MKKILLSIITIFTLNISIKAQIRFGFKGGLNFANISISPVDSSFTQSNIISFHAGLVINKKLSEKISLQSDLLFSQKGYSLLNSFNATTYKSKTTLNYFEIPFNFLYHITNKFTIGTGIYLGYAIGGTTTTIRTYNNVSETDTRNMDFDNILKRPDYGLNFMTGYEIIEGIVISANYSLGLAHINSNASPEIVKNNVIGLSLVKFLKDK